MLFQDKPIKHFAHNWSVYTLYLLFSETRNPIVRIREAQKHVAPADPDPQHCIKLARLLRAECSEEKSRSYDIHELGQLAGQVLQGLNIPDIILKK
jgi:hypothetical protein